MTCTLSSQKDYSDDVFRNLKLEQAEIEASDFYDCTFSGCSFVESIFRHCRFVGCLFDQCDLSLVQLPETVFSGARFDQSRIIGVNWTHADWSTTRLGKPMEFLSCTINHSTFIGLTLTDIRIEECKAADCDFREADLSRASFMGTDLSESLFSETNLTGADFRGARNYHIPPGQNTLRKARFSMPEAMALLYSLDIELTEDAD